MNDNGASPRIGLLLAHRIIRSEMRNQTRILKLAKQKNYIDSQEETDYALAILARVAEKISTEAKKHNGRTANK